MNELKQLHGILKRMSKKHPVDNPNYFQYSALLINYSKAFKLLNKHMSVNEMDKDELITLIRDLLDVSLVDSEWVTCLYCGAGPLDIGKHEHSTDCAFDRAKKLLKDSGYDIGREW